MAQLDLHENFLVSGEPTVHKKKTHAAGEGQAITIEGIRIDFPLKPYPAQIQMMTRIIHALNKEENALLESPTGSGKSLALLCAALAWRENQERIKAADIIQRSFTEKRPIKDEPDTTELPAKKIKTRMASPPSFCSDDDFQRPLVKRFIGELVETDEEKSEELSTPELASMDEVKKMKYETYKAVPRIFVGSRTHKQIAQLVEELKSNTRYRPRTTVLGSREHLCIHPKVSKSNNKTDDCTNLLDDNKCSFAHRTKKILNHPSLQTTNRIWDIEDMVQLGKNVRGCPYYAARKLYEGAEVIFCPYNYIIDPVIRNILDINLSNSIVILDEAHNIEDASRAAGSIDIDEASLEVLIKELKLTTRFGGEKESHQYMNTVISHLYDAVKSEDIVYTVKEYERQSCHFTGTDLLNKLNQVYINCNTFQDEIFPAYKKISAHADAVRKAKENKAISVADDYEIEEIDGLSSQVHVEGTRAVSNGSLTVLQGLMTVLKFIFASEQTNAKDYQLVFMRSLQRPGGKAHSRRRRNKDQDRQQSLWVHKIGFWCLSPAIVFQDMCEKTHSVILTSGTLSPLNTFASELGVEFSGRLEANHVIKPSQVWISSIPQGPNRIPLKCVYSNMESLGFQDEVGETLRNITERVPYGILVFMPSYKALDIFLDRWKITGVMDQLKEKKLVLSEPKGSDKKEFEAVLNTFYDQIDTVAAGVDEEGRDGALFFAVFRGKVSEGIDFSDNYCRAVVTMGIPFPGFKDLEVNLKRDYNNRMKSQPGSKELLSGHEWYEAQAYRAINQALGRCIRHRNDWGAIILLEERFNNRNVVNGLSKWVKGQFKQLSHFGSSMEGLEHFVKRQLEEDRQKAEEEREKMRIQEESTIKVESPSIITDAIVIHGSQSFESKEESVISIDTSNGTSDQGEQSSILATSKYFNQYRQNDPLQLQSTENTINESQEPLSATMSETDDNEVLLIEDFPNKQEPDDYTDKSAHIKLLDEGNSHETNDNNLYDLSPPPKLIYAKLEMHQQYSNTNITAPSSSVSDTIHFSCPNCNKNLLNGPRDDIELVEVADLECIKTATDNRCLVQVLQNPGLWETTLQLLGDPLKIQSLASRTSVIYDRMDDLCFRPLACACNALMELGMVVCLATNPIKMHHVGKVYLWGFDDDRLKNAGVSFKSKELCTTEDLNMEIPNSQYSSANDIFYNL
ncbi:hypothetical protein [Parasitella parasitica]|uniref:DNA 5'-3' helicase n=1 Tax=Parasitella parasitica TaxID=35722 RepID=A0A0B7N4P3_9FUNG|nr:hypothetical protein [Parasitella parasitica]